MIDVLIVGAGPAGLAAAIELRRRGVERVVIAEREREPGGIPRHSQHLGYGMRDLHRLMNGPRYAARYVEMAQRAGVEIRLSTTVFDASPCANESQAVLLATGVRERPRSARLIPGDRPAGVFTTGALQQLVKAAIPVGTRAVIVGAEHVSYSAILTLRHGGCTPVALVTELPRHQTHRALALATAGIHRVPLHAGRRVANVIGRSRVEAVELDDGQRIACDTVVFTGDWIPDLELARSSGVAISAASRGPSVDAQMRTSIAGVFAAGNLMHGAETADVCALEGKRAAASIAGYLHDTARAWPTAGVAILVEPPLIWVSPNVISLGSGKSAAAAAFLHLWQSASPPTSTLTSMSRPPSWLGSVSRSRLRSVSRFTPSRLRSTAPPRLLLRTAVDLSHRSVEVSQGQTILWRGRSRGCPSPNRSFSIPGDWQANVAPDPATPVTITAAQN